MIKINRHLYIGILSILFVASIIFNKFYAGEVYSIIAMLLLTVLAGLHIFKKALIDLKYLIFGIDLLVMIAVIGAIIIGDYFEAAAVTYLFTLGHYLEKGSLEKTRSAIADLIDLKPVMARKIVYDVEVIIPAEEVVVGDILLVKPGEKIPADGSIIEGYSSIDEQMMTGESLPVDKKNGDLVYSGTIISSGYIKMKALKIGDDTTFSKIIEMVEEAQDKKAKTQKFIEKFAKYYTPSIIVFSIAIYLITFDIRMAITMLVISCPGALVISTPVSIVAGIGNAAKRGILFKGGESLEKLAKNKIILMDKTGTLTKGQPTVKHVKTYDFNENHFIKIIGLGEKYSEHPIAATIVKFSREHGNKLTEEIKNVDFSIGRGVTFQYEHETYNIGNDRLINSDLINEDILKDINDFHHSGQTCLIVSNSKRVIGLIAISDEIKSESYLLAEEFKRNKIHEYIMLTGDNEEVAKAVSSELNLTGYHAQLLPQDKYDIVRKYQDDFNRVTFIGDGINDALALSIADVGVAVGGIGKDIAMETADVILMSDKVSKINEAIAISKKVRMNILENIGFALIVVFLLILGVILKVVNMSIGMLFHEVSVLIVIINAIRLLGYKYKGVKNEGKS